MTTKAQYLTALEGESFISAVGTPVLESSKTDTELDINTYRVQMIENSPAGEIVINSHLFSVIDEGGGGEAAYPFGQAFTPGFDENNIVYAAIEGYIAGLTSVKGFRISDYSTSNQWAKVLVWEYVTDHIEEKYYFVYNDSGLTHEEITSS